MVGGQDELVFDGGSFIVDGKGAVLAKGKQFSEELIVVDVDVQGAKFELSRKDKRELKTLMDKDESIDKIKVPSGFLRKQKPAVKRKRRVNLSSEEEVYRALLLGTKDYVTKNDFTGTVIGMSGGIDSALVATIAVDALGKENVHGLFMPSMYTSKESFEDAYMQKTLE
jgi:NAD+ synthase (glutamine-hydrolysing)